MAVADVRAKGSQFVEVHLERLGQERIITKGHPPSDGSLTFPGGVADSVTIDQEVRTTYS